MRLCMGVCVCVRAPFVQQGSIATITTTMRPFAAVAVAVTLCVSVLAILLFNTHTPSHTHTCKLHPYFNGSQAKYRCIPMMKLHVAKCATAAHAHIPHPTAPPPIILPLSRSSSSLLSSPFLSSPFIHLSPLAAIFGLLQND